MTVMTRLLESHTTALGPNRVEAIAGTSNKARDGHIVRMSGMDTSAFLRSGTILFNHDPSKPVGIPVSGRVDSGGNLRLVIDFAGEGLSKHADEVRNLVKAGILRNLSIGFDPLEMEPLDPRNPRGGQLITRSELLEVSVVGVPADVGAVVTARSGRSGKVLSGANAAALRDAHDAAKRCHSILADVLDGAGESGFAETERRGLSAEYRRRQVESLRLAGVPHKIDHNSDFGRRQRQLDVLSRSEAVLIAEEVKRAERSRAVRQLHIPSHKRKR